MVSEVVSLGLQMCQTLNLLLRLSTALTDWWSYITLAYLLSLSKSLKPSNGEEERI